MNKNINELNETELKAVAYDQLALIEQSQNNLRTINQRLAVLAQEKEQSASVEKPLKPKEKPEDK